MARKTKTERISRPARGRFYVITTSTGREVVYLKDDAAAAYKATAPGFSTPAPRRLKGPFRTRRGADYFAANVEANAALDSETILTIERMAAGVTEAVSN
jgi:hypothetical protein